MPSYVIGTATLGVNMTVPRSTGLAGVSYPGPIGPVGGGGGVVTGDGPSVNAVGYLWPRGDGTPAAT